MEAEKQEKRGKQHGDGNQKDNQGNMLQLAERVERHYTSPSPAATIHRPAFFPQSLDHGIFWGLFAGALLGLLLSWLLRSGTVTPSGWEGLFSLSPFTFYAFWAFAGAALGLLVGGAISILATPPPILQEETEEHERFVTGEEEQVVMVDVEK
jgi:hypothetical protein